MASIAARGGQCGFLSVRTLRHESGRMNLASVQATEGSPGRQGCLHKPAWGREQRRACQRCAASAAGAPDCGIAAPDPPGHHPEKEHSELHLTALPRLYHPPVPKEPYA